MLTWIVQMLQTRVALKRIEVFLEEEVVDGQVSSLNEGEGFEGEDGRERFEPGVFGLRNASFKRNAVEEKGKDKNRDEGGKDKKDGSGNGKKRSLRER